MKTLMQKIEKKRFRREHKNTVRKWYAEEGETRLRYDYDLNPDSIVLDLGGYEGEWAGNIFARYLCTIHVFEPVTAFAQQIEDRFRKNDRIKAYPFGLGGSTRSEDIHLDANSSSTMGSSTNVEQISLVDVHEWLTENSIGQIALMKINIEGGEYELMERMLDTGIISQVTNFQIQFHNFEEDSRSRMEQIRRGLEKTHTCTYQYDFVWENWALNA